MNAPVHSLSRPLVISEHIGIYSIQLNNHEYAGNLEFDGQGYVKLQVHLHAPYISIIC
jgi:hypothetical protein